MANVIYMPKTTNPFEAMLPTFLSQMILQDQAAKIKERFHGVEQQEKESEREFGLQQSGYTRAEALPYEVPGQQKADITTPGGKGYMAPQYSMGAPQKIAGTTSVMIPQMRNGKITGYQVLQKTEQTADQTLAEQGLFKAGDSIYKLSPDGTVALAAGGGKYTPKGFETKTNRLIVQDPKGDLVYQDDKTSYKGGQLQPLTEPQMISMMKDYPGFTTMPKEDKEFWYEQYSKDKTALPPFYYRDPESKNAFIKGYSEWERARGGTGGSVTAERASTKSLGASLQFQQKNRGMMGSFVTNINGQVGKVEQISKDIVARVGLRGLDLPIRKLNTTFIGSGHENVLAAYMKEISAEIAKLSQGSTASIAQLPEGNREEWEKIHDVNLSFKELLTVLKGTRDMANIRLKSVDDEIAKTEKTLKTPGVSSEAKANNDPLGIR